MLISTFSNIFQLEHSIVSILLGKKIAFFFSLHVYTEGFFSTKIIARQLSSYEDNVSFHAGGKSQITQITF